MLGPILTLLFALENTLSSKSSLKYNWAWGVQQETGSGVQ